MAKKIDWLYERKHCVTCQKARAFFADDEPTVKERVDAAKTRIAPEEVPDVLAKVKKLVVARGKNVTRIDLAKEPMDQEAIAKHLIGPSGNLRAPSVIVGKTMYVGFTPEMYDELKG